MPYFLSPENLKPGQALEVGGEEAAHMLLSRRLKVGKVLVLQGPNGKRFLCEVLTLGKRMLKVGVKEAVSVPKEPEIFITLYQAFVNQSSLDFIFQKSTELQVSRIVIFNSQNTAGLLSLQKFDEKRVRWGRILQEAAKQCERAGPPQLAFHQGLTEVVSELAKLDKGIIFDPLSMQKFKDLKISNLKTLGLIVGPEGGFTREEIRQILAQPNTQGVNLGPVLLRAETAVIAALALSQNL